MKVTFRVTLRRPDKLVDFAIHHEDWPAFIPWPIVGDIVTLEGEDHEVKERTVRPWPHPEDGYASYSLGEIPLDAEIDVILEYLPGFTLEVLPQPLPTGEPGRGQSVENASD